MTELDRLLTIQPLPVAAQDLSTLAGFIRSYEALVRSCKTYKNAYETLELQHVRIFGFRKYADYSCFKAVYWRRRKAERCKK